MPSSVGVYWKEGRTRQVVGRVPQPYAALARRHVVNFGDVAERVGSVVGVPNVCRIKKKRLGTVISITQKDAALT